MNWKVIDLDWSLDTDNFKIIISTLFKKFIVAKTNCMSNELMVDALFLTNSKKSACRHFSNTFQPSVLVNCNEQWISQCKLKIHDLKGFKLILFPSREQKIYLGQSSLLTFLTWSSVTFIHSVLSVWIYLMCSFPLNLCCLENSSHSQIIFFLKR